MSAPVDHVEVDELRIGLLCPAPRSRIEFVRKDGHSDGDLDALDIEEAEVALPVQT